MGNRSDTKVGQPNPPTVTSMQHDGVGAVSKQAALAQSTIQEGGRAEATALGSRGGKGGHLKGVQRLWDPPGYGYLLQIHGESDLGIRLAGGDQEYGEGAGGMDEDGEDPQQGGFGATGVHIFLKICCSINTDFRRRNMGGYSLNGPDPWGVPGPGDATIGGEASATTDRREVGIHLSSGGKGGGGV